MLYLCWTQIMERGQWEKWRKQAEVIKPGVWLGRSEAAALRCQTKPVYFLSRLFSFKQLMGELDPWYLETMYVFHRDGVNVFAEGATKADSSAGTCSFTFKVIQNHERSYWCSGLCERWIEVDRNAINNVWLADFSKHFIIRGFRHSLVDFPLFSAVVIFQTCCSHPSWPCMWVRGWGSFLNTPTPPKKKKRKTALIPQIWRFITTTSVSLLDCWRTLQMKCRHLNTFLYLWTF